MTHNKEQYNIRE